MQSVSQLLNVLFDGTVKRLLCEVPDSYSGLQCMYFVPLSPPYST